MNAAALAIWAFSLTMAATSMLATAQEPQRPRTEIERQAVVERDKQTLAAQRAEQELQTLRALSSELKAHRETLEKQAERQFAAVENTVNRLTLYYGAFLTGVVVIALWLFGPTMREWKTTLKEWLDEKGQKAIDDANKELRQRIEVVRNDVESLLNYREKRIIWVCPPSTWQIPDGKDRNPKAEVNQEILKAIHATGLHNIQLVTPAAPEDSFELGTPDLVLFSFDGTESAKKVLASVVEHLKRITPPVFLLVDTFMPGEPPRMMKPDDFKVLEGFLWYVPANFPSQLVAQTQLLIRRDTSALVAARG